MTVGAALQKIKQQLQTFSHPRLEADRLLAHVLGVEASDLIRRESEKLDPEKTKWLEAAVERRLNGEPLAYVLESQGFFKSEFVVRKGVLVPRPETELVVETALRLYAGRAPETFADLGCGSGCIGLSLLREWPTAHLLAIDASVEAVVIARENMEKLGLQNRCEIRHSPVDNLEYQNRFDLVVANPPYIAVDDPRVEENVRRHEPHEALFAGEKGLSDIFAWSAWAIAALRPGGWWITEIGTGQNEEVGAKLMELGFLNLGIKKDLAGHSRVICAQKPNLF
jgi:release factor glutamine methyltransferase